MDLCRQQRHHTLCDSCDVQEQTIEVSVHRLSFKRDEILGVTEKSSSQYTPLTP